MCFVSKTNNAYLSNSASRSLLGNSEGEKETRHEPKHFDSHDTVSFWLSAGVTVVRKETKSNSEEQNETRDLCPPYCHLSFGSELW